MAVQPKGVGSYFTCVGKDFLMGTLPWKGAQILCSGWINSITTSVLTIFSSDCITLLSLVEIHGK